MDIYKTIIIGGGPAGLAAAIYTGRARLRTLVLEKVATGGQLLLTDYVENYPGILQTEGGRLMETFLEQAQKFGAELAYGEVHDLRPNADGYEIVTGEETYHTLSIIVATGSSHRHIGVPGEKELWGKGVSVCATCDGAFFKDQIVAVIGGGDSALTEAIFLKNLCRQVYIIHRRDELRAEQILQERAIAASNISFCWNTVLEEIVGEKEVTSVRVKNVKTGERSEIALSAVFVAIGMTPNSGFLRPLVKLDENGFVLATHQMATSAPGIFVAGDVRSASYRQIATSVGDGVTAAMSVELWLENSGLIPALK